MEKITFITTVKNDVKGTEMLFSSLLSQSRLPDQIVVVDAMSNDGTEEVIKKYETSFRKKNIPLLIIRKDCNRARGRNIAIKKATHNIIAVSDAGCFLSKHWMRDMTKHFDNKDIDVVAGYYQSGGGSIFQRCVATYTCVMPDKLTATYLPSSRSVAFKKSAWTKVHGYPEHLDYCEDLVFARNMRESGIHFIIEKMALVTWPQVTTWLAIARQLFMYARGDGQALYVRPQTPLLFARYIVALSMFAIGFYYHTMWLYLLIAAIAYLLWAIQKNYQYVQHPKAYTTLPTLQLVADAAVLIGMLVGFFSRFYKKDEHSVSINTFSLILGKTVVAGLGFASTFLLTRYLGATQYSQYAYAFSLTSAFFLCADFGLSLFVVRNTARGKLPSELLGSVIFVRTALSVVAAIGIIFYASFQNFSPSLLIMLGLFACYQWIQYVALSFEAFLQGKQNFVKAVLPQVASALISLTGMCLFILMKGSVESLIIALLIGQIGGLLIYTSISGSPHWFRGITLRSSMNVLRGGLPLALGVVLSTLYFKIDVILLGVFYHPDTSSAVGIYSIAYKWFEIGLVFTGYSIQVLFPHFSSLQGTLQFSSVVKKYFAYILCIGIIISSILFSFAPSLIMLLAGNEFISSIALLRILSFALLPSLLGGYFMTVLLSLSKDKGYVVVAATALIVNFVLNIYYIPQLGASAAAWTTVVTQMYIMCAYGLMLYISMKSQSDNLVFDKNFYDGFHAAPKKQIKIIDEKDYTQGPLVKLVRPYLKTHRAVLDVGCGTGTLALYIASQGNKVTGVDISRQAIDAASAYAQDMELNNVAKFYTGTIRSVPRKSLFDMVCAIEIIEHVPNDDMFLASIFERLLPGGIMVLSTPSRNAPLLRLGFLDGFEKRVGHVRRYDRGEIEHIVKNAGFHIDRVVEHEGCIRNFMYTSTIGTVILLRLVNRFRFIQVFFEKLDEIALRLAGPSDIILIAKKNI